MFEHEHWNNCYSFINSCMHACMHVCYEIKIENKVHKHLRMLTHTHSYYGTNKTKKKKNVKGLKISIK